MSSCVTFRLSIMAVSSSATSDSVNDLVTIDVASNVTTNPVRDGVAEGTLLVGDTTGTEVGFGVMNTAHIDI